MTYFEEDMKNQGYDLIMTSTQVDEEAQHFYRKLGYIDSGSILFVIPNYEQPAELVMMKKL